MEENKFLDSEGFRFIQSTYIDKENNILIIKKQGGRFIAEYFGGCKVKVTSKNAEDYSRISPEAFLSRLNPKARKWGKSKLEQLAQARKSEEKTGWIGIFKNVRYSSGPGDNMYVYG